MARASYNPIAAVTYLSSAITGEAFNSDKINKKNKRRAFIRHVKRKIFRIKIRISPPVAFRICRKWSLCLLYCPSDTFCTLASHISLRLNFQGMLARADCRRFSRRCRMSQTGPTQRAEAFQRDRLRSTRQSRSNAPVLASTNASISGRATHVRVRHGVSQCPAALRDDIAHSSATNCLAHPRPAPAGSRRTATADRMGGGSRQAVR